MSKITITKRQACRFILAYQGLFPPHDLKGKAGILEYIRRVGCIQFDPLNMAGYNQELVLQSRVSGFRPPMLQELLYTDRKLLDGWDKNMSIYCTEDWPYFRRGREKAQNSLKGGSSPVLSIVPQVRKEIEERGPLSSADLDYNQEVDWPWAPTRLARAVLESMYFCGDLIIHHKARTRKAYDLARRHIAKSLLFAPDPNATQEQYHDWYILRRIGGIGLLWNKSGDAWLGMGGIESTDRSKALSRLLAQEKVLEIGVEGIKQPLYMRSEYQHLLDRTLACEEPPAHAAILAPLDNLLWDRQLVKELFDFDYRWEVYKPAAQRQYGYYVLPVLYQDRFVARFEPQRDRDSGALLVKNWWWEPGIKKSKKLYSGLHRCFELFTGYLGASGVVVDKRTLEREKLDWLSTALCPPAPKEAGPSAPVCPR